MITFDLRNDSLKPSPSLMLWEELKILQEQCVRTFTIVTIVLVFIISILKKKLIRFYWKRHSWLRHCLFRNGCYDCYEKNGVDTFYTLQQ